MSEKYKLFGLDTFGKRPEVVLTFEEALDKGLDPYHPQGYYTTIHGVIVPIIILNCVGQEINPPTPTPILPKIKKFFKSFHW